MKSLSRASALKIAASVGLLLCLVTIPGSLSFVVQGASSVNRAPAGPPYIVELILFIAAVLGVVAAYGVWKQMRWGVVLMIVACLANVLVALPGILFGPRPWGLLASALTVALSIIVIVCCLWRDRQPAVA